MLGTCYITIGHDGDAAVRIASPGRLRDLACEGVVSMNTLRVACAVLPTVLDRDQPLRILQWENIDAHLQLYEPLLGYAGAEPATAGSPDSKKLVGLMAERWERSDDAKTWCFFLRRSVFSAFGHEMTAKDVAWTWKRSLALGTVGAWIGSNAGLHRADQVKAIDRYTVEFTLPYSTSILPYLLTVIVPTVFDSTEVKKYVTPDDPWALKTLQKRGLGYGPYTVDESSDETVFRMCANPRYWAGPVGYERVEMVAILDPADRWDALKNGEVDVAIDLNEPAGTRNGVVVHHLPTTWRTMLGCNVTRPPFDKLNIRRAVALAIPYQRIVDEAFRGGAKRMTSCISDVVTGHTAAHRSWNYDPAEARRLLKPYLPLPPIELAYHDEFAHFPRIARIVAEALGEVGVKVKPAYLDLAQHGLKKLDRALNFFVDQDGPITIDGRYALGHDVNPPLKGVFDFTGYHSDEIDGYLAASLKELDDGKMVALLGEVQRVVLNDLPWIPLAQHSFVVGISRKVAGHRWFPLSRLRARHLSPAA